jgi:hypothetical protein
VSAAVTRSVLRWAALAICCFDFDSQSRARKLLSDLILKHGVDEVHLVVPVALEQDLDSR